MTDPGADRLIVVGAGLAGLMVALHLAPAPVVILTKAKLGADAASAWAQGGIAAALGMDDDPLLHAQDTLACGDGLCDPDTVRRMTGAAAGAIEALIGHGAYFDRSAAQNFNLALEGGHSRRRILHAADSTGRAIMEALIAAVRQTPSIEVLEGVEARGLIKTDNRIAGVLATLNGRPVALASSRVVMATGGIGGLFDHTTNPLSAIGAGIAMAVRAGAALADMEFVQFHPTALDVGRDPMPLVSEAVRGECAVLVDETGCRVMWGDPRGDLAPRDVVSRTLWQHLVRGHRTFLDTRPALGADFAQRFPAIAQICRAAGIDPTQEPIPVRPAAHYAMGGIAVDASGRSSVPGLWACGEVASTGLHGANRLASNSLLEAVVAAQEVAEDIAGTPAGKPHHVTTKAVPAMALPSATASRVLRRLMSQNVGIQRNQASLQEAIAELALVAFGQGSDADAALVGLMIATAALRREESRGAHWRTDFTGRAHDQAERATLDLADAMQIVEQAVDRPIRIYAQA